MGELQRERDECATIPATLTPPTRSEQIQQTEDQQDCNRTEYLHQTTGRGQYPETALSSKSRKHILLEHVGNIY